MTFLSVKLVPETEYTGLTSQEIVHQVLLKVALFIGKYDSTCVRRSYGVLITKDGKIIGKGYNGDYDCCHRNCIREGTCLRDLENIGDDEFYCPCLREELGLDVDAEHLDGSILYIAAYDKRKDCLVSLPLDPECVKHLDEMGVDAAIEAK